MKPWPNILTIVRAGRGYRLAGVYDPADPRTPTGPYNGNELEAKADAEVDLKIIRARYHREWATYYDHAREYETLADQAELWAETVMDRMAPPRGTPAWDKMYAGYLRWLFQDYL
jgi:hypothetical protein